MAEKLFSLEVLTPRKKIFSGQVASVVAPGTLGYLGILANHAPLMTTLGPGRIVCRESSGASRVIYAAGEGFLEVYKNQVSVLVDEVTEPSS